MQSSTFLLTLAIAATFVAVTQGCSCMFSHPQQQYCQADFVILARVKREYVYNDTRVYKVRIRKEYKMSEKAEVALKSGRLITAAEESACGIPLEKGKVYAISGRIRSLKAYINYCDFVKRWDKLTKRQRKGLNRMYRLGCSCGIKRCFAKNCHKTKDFCIWNTSSFYDNVDCQRMQGICLRSASGKCAWARNKLQAACMKNFTSTRTTTKPHTISLWSG